jgi:hypothetical protein
LINVNGIHLDFDCGLKRRTLTDITHLDHDRCEGEKENDHGQADEKSHLRLESGESSNCEKGYHANITLINGTYQ